MSMSETPEPRAEEMESPHGNPEKGETLPPKTTESEVNRSEVESQLSEEEFKQLYPALAWRGKTLKDVEGMSVQEIEAAEREADLEWNRLYLMKVIP